MGPSCFPRCSFTALLFPPRGVWPLEEPQSRVGSRSGRESCSPFGRQARALAPLARCEGLEPPGRRQALEGPAFCPAPARGSHGHRARSCPGLWLVGPRRTQEALRSCWPGGLRPRTRRLRPNPSFTAPLGAPGLCTSCPVPRTPSPRNSWARHPRPHHLQPAGLSTPWTACRKATRATPWPRCCERWVWSDLVLRPEPQVRGKVRRRRTHGSINPGGGGFLVRRRRSS